MTECDENCGCYEGISATGTVPRSVYIDGVASFYVQDELITAEGIHALLSGVLDNIDLSLYRHKVKENGDIYFYKGE